MEVQADLAAFVPVKRSDLIVTYGPVEIGGKTYILPVRSVSLSRGRTVVWLHQDALAFKTWPSRCSGNPVPTLPTIRRSELTDKLTSQAVPCPSDYDEKCMPTN